MKTGKKGALEEKYLNALQEMASIGDTVGINKLMSSPSFKKIRLGAGLTRAAAVAGSDYLGGMAGNILQTASGVSLASQLPQAGKELNKRQSDAYQRKMNNMSGEGNGWGDTKASIGNIGKSASDLSKLAFYGSAASGVSGLSSSMLLTPGMMAMNGTKSLMAGAGLGGTLGSVATGVAPIMALMAAMKGGKMAYDWTQEGSSTNKKMSMKQMITKGTSPHELESEFSNTTRLYAQIQKLQNMGGLKPGEALIAQILAMIEGHTSVLPFIAAESKDSEERRNKEGGNTSQQILSELFGYDGANAAATPGKQKEGIVSKLFTGLELGMSNLQASVNPFAAFSNLFAGKSSVALYNEANSKDELDALHSEEKFAAKFGMSTTLVQAMHMTPAQIMDKADTYEGKTLSILGLISENVRGSHIRLVELATSAGASPVNGSLNSIREQTELENMENFGTYKKYFKSIDEVLGYLPVFSNISNAIKTVADGIGFLDDIASDKRSITEVFTDYMTGKVKNTNLDSEEALRKSVGAVELSTTELMASYLGVAFPDRFELLLQYNLSQKESLESMAGGIRRTKLEKLSMNRYTGELANNGYHDAKDQDIKLRMGDEMGYLESTGGVFSDWFTSKNKDKMVKSQLETARKNNPFLDNFMGDSRTSQIDPTGAQANQDAQLKEEKAEKRMSLAEQQVELLQDIRDCLKCKGKDYAGANKRRRQQQEDNASDNGFSLGGYGGYGGGSGGNKPTRKKQPKAGLWKKFKSLMSVKGIRKMLNKGGFKSILKNLLLVIPGTAILGALKNPYVATAIGIGILGYSAYAYIDNMMNDTKDSKISKKQRNNLEKVNDEISNISKLTGMTVDKVISSKGLRSKSVDELQYLLKISDEPLTRLAVTKVLKEKKVKGNHLDTSGNFGSDSTLIDSSFFGKDSWKKDAQVQLNNASSKALLQLLADDKSLNKKDFSGNYFNPEMRRKVESLIKLRDLRKSGNLTGKNNYNGSQKLGGLYVTQSFKENIYNKAGKKVAGHGGIDFGTGRVPKAVYSISSGEVRVYDWSNDNPDTRNKSGNSVTVIDSNGDELQYFHLSAIGINSEGQTLKTGDYVEVGDILGMSGNTGSTSTGIHIHIQYKKRGATTTSDPIPYMEKWKYKANKKTSVTVKDPQQDNQTASAVVFSKEQIATRQQALASRVRADGKFSKGEAAQMQQQINFDMAHTNDQEQINILKQQSQLLAGIVNAVKGDKVIIYTLDKNEKGNGFTDILKSNPIIQ